jgi:hypothetical protein
MCIDKCEQGEDVLMIFFTKLRGRSEEAFGLGTKVVRLFFNKSENEIKGKVIVPLFFKGG